MVRTQIQLPDEVYKRARKLSKSREISMAELARRGIEYMLSVYAPEQKPETEWKLPTKNLGWKGLDEDDLKAQAQLTNSEIHITRQRRK